MKERIAMYLRLSLEDVDKRSNSLKEESNSIVAQRSLIDSYLSQDTQLCSLARMEFCDDGFSGTNFQRPDFTRMIECAKHGEISCIVVKDLSRFGRDYLEVGDYLEHIFPFLGIRFISINDHYDSLQHEGKTIGMDVAFKNLVYDYYSKDLSKKVKSAMSMKQREAKYVNTAPYGYVVDPADKHHLIIEPNTAVVVRRIFMDVIAGKSCTQIAKELNAENIPTPAQQKSVVRKTIQSKVQWTHWKVLKLIANIKYTGTMVNHTRESRFIRDKSQCRLPPEEWFIRENAHEAIVTRDEYQQAQEAIPHRKKSVRVSHDQSDRVYFCAHCGGKLEKANGTVFACPAHRYHKASMCANVRWRKADLESIIFEALKRQIRIVRLEATTKQSDSLSSDNDLEKKLSLLNMRYSSCDREKIALYESYREGVLNKDEYLLQKNAVVKHQTMLKAQIEDCETEIQRKHDMALVDEYHREMLRPMNNLTDTELKTHLYDAVERVIIYDTESIEIVWKFDRIEEHVNKNTEISK